MVIVLLIKILIIPILQRSESPTFARMGDTRQSPPSCAASDAGEGQGAENATAEEMEDSHPPPGHEEEEEEERSDRALVV